MLFGGFWCAIVGAVVGSRFGFLFLIGGGIMGLVSGVFAGALFHECAESIFERARLAHESKRSIHFAILIAVYASLWIAAIALLFSSLGLVVRT